MKQTLCIFCILSLLLCCGCSTAPGSGAATTDTTNATSDPTVTTQIQPAVPEQKPMISVSMPVITEETTAPDGTVVFRHTYQSMELILPDPDVAEAVILDYLTRSDNEDAAATLSAQAADAFAANPDHWVAHLAQTTYAPKRIDNGVLSLLGNEVTFTGGAHADAVYQSVNYDLVTGKVISLSDFLSEDLSADALSQMVIDSLSSQKEAKGIWDGFETAVRSRFSDSYLQDKDWYFSTTGLCFFFSPYEIGPYASGVITAEVPYEKLAGKANDAYFPVELEPAYGKLAAAEFTDSDPSKYTQIAEVILSESGDKVMLYTDLSVNNLTIELGQWSADGQHFTSQYTIFSTPLLTPGDAVLIGYEFTQTLPSVRVTYSCSDGIMQQYIALDPTNHSVILSQ